jgi:hypothetical protein
MPSEAGIEARYVFVPPTPVLWGWEGQPSLLRRTINYGAAVSGAADFVAFAFSPFNWDIPSFQPPHPRPERAGAVATSEPGIEATFIFTQPLTWGWADQPSLLTLRYLPQGRMIPDTGDQGIEAPFAKFYPSGWEVAPPLTRHQLFKSPDIGDQGTQAPFINWVNFNWYVPPFQPSHPKPERAGAVMPSEPGVEAVYVFVPLTFFPEGWQIPPFQPPTLAGKLNRFAGIVHGRDGIEFPFIRFLPSGWEVQPFQPPHPRPERAAAVMPWEAGIEAQYVFVPAVPVIWGWEQPPFHVKQPKSSRYFGIEGTSDFASFDFQPYGWEIAPFQPSHPRPERSGAIPTGDQGTQARFVFVTPPFTVLGWDIPSFQPPHRAPEFKAAALLRGDDGIQSQFIRWFNMGWEIPPYQPQHPRFERAGSIMVGHQGTDGIYVFVPPPIKAFFDPRYVTYAPPRITVTYAQPRINVTFE